MTSQQPARRPSLQQHLVAAAKTWWRRQSDRRQLLAMSESELRDLGIGRSQIPGLTELPPAPPSLRKACAGHAPSAWAILGAKPA